MRLTTTRVALLATLLIAYNLLWDPLAHSVPAQATSVPAQATPRVAPAVQPLNATATPPVQHLEFDLDALLHNPLSAPTEAEQRTQTLQCPNYAGPMFFPYHPGAKNVPRKPVPAAMTTASDAPPAFRAPPRPLQPFHLKDVRLTARTAFHAAQQTNLAWLKQLEPDRMLYFFRQLAKLPQPAPTLQPYGGWESAGSGLRGEFIGHWLSAVAAAAAGGAEPELRSRAEYVVTALGQCQDEVSGYLSAFPQSEFAATESFYPKGPWVPYYVMHKLLVGLLEAHSLLGLRLALTVALKLSEHLRGRVEKMLASGGEQRWEEFINQEVGGMSEALTQLAVATKDPSWVQLAKRFERPCFVGPLALVGASTKRGAAQAIEKMHANTHLPEILGAAARYEATGEPAAARAAMSFFDELNASHTFATGGSTSGETWLGARQLGGPVAQQHAENYWSHDHHETCVSHNSMRTSRSIMAWGAGADAGGAAPRTMWIVWPSCTAYESSVSGSLSTLPL